MSNQTQTYRVTCNGAMTDTARAALGGTPIQLFASTGGATLSAAGGKLPEPSSHSFIVPASSSDEAVNTVRQALEPVGGFGNFAADPPTPLG